MSGNEDTPWWAIALSVAIFVVAGLALADIYIGLPQP